MNQKPMAQTSQIETASNGIIAHAPAKINLCLLVCGKRPDGFHNLRTIMAKIDWFDKLTFEHSNMNGIELVCDGPQWAPTGPDNLVYKAVSKICDLTGTKPQVKVTLTKNIPAGSGLGSASSDAAAALLAYNKFAGLKLTSETLQQLASQLGSDVPFFLGPPQALCEGRGEKITGFSKNFNFSALLILPNINTSTKRVYENYCHGANLFEALNSKFSTFLEQNKLDLVIEMCANMLEDSCFCLHPEIYKLKLKIEHLGIKPLMLSGSGSTLFHILPNRRKEVLSEYLALLEKINCAGVIVSNNNW